jgi:hypothetical protein
MMVASWSFEMTVEGRFDPLPAMMARVTRWPFGDGVRQGTRS